MPWICEVCDEENLDDWRNCKHCSRMKGTWICRWCGQKHCETAKACRSCGMPKGTAPPE